ncbi:caspase-1-A-like isoform X2 [Mixophyes fleayi]|uniref:caspase-1-A-like isoform X2 n=1 Tax=Mixophyes fleayi TaxID=3061075 RepID=UPI003F4D8585
MADKLHELRTQLINRCNTALVRGLLDDLQHKKILSSSEVETIDEGNPLCRDKCRALIDIVKKKGDYSSNVLITQVFERDPTLSETLGIKATGELPLPTQEQQNVQPSQSEVNGITLCSENEYREITTKEKERYPIQDKCKRTRLALIICNDKFEHLEERRGAEFDLNGMRNLLEGFGYRVHSETNLTAEGMRAAMRAFAVENDHKDSDSTFLVFMSHGEKDIICGTDRKKIKNEHGQDKMIGALPVHDIFNIFNNVNCSVLRDKPKVIIIQACRGSEKSKVLACDCDSEPHSIEPEQLEDDTMRMIQKERDFICFYSTTPDTVSWRHKNSGSLFIQRLIEVLKKDAHCTSLEDMFRKVQLSFKDDIQMPTQERKTLMKKFFLFPGW